MVGNSKILTVSYGTFSCTLEGFDDSFDTMKAIAEYFRDLAADDRYFGAEPPTPDADMLARIAEREIERRVEARVGATGIVLRAAETQGSGAEQVTAEPQAEAGGEGQDESTVAPVAAAEVEEIAETVADAVAEATVEAREAEEAAQPEVADPVAAVAESYEEDAYEEDLEAADAPAAFAAPAPTAAPADSVAAKLQRIRAVVAKTAPTAATAATAAPDLMAEWDKDAESDVAEDASDALEAEGEAEIEVEVEVEVEVEDVVAEGEDDEGPAEDEDDDDDLQSLAALLSSDTDEDEEAAEAASGDLSEDQGEGIDEDADILADLSALRLDDDADESDEEALAAPDLITDAADEDVAPVKPARRARAMKMSRKDFDAALASGEIEALDEAAGKDGAGALSDEDEADLMRELAELEEVSDDDDRPALDDMSLMDAGDDAELAAGLSDDAEDEGDEIDLSALSLDVDDAAEEDGAAPDAATLDDEDDDLEAEFAALDDADDDDDIEMDALDDEDDEDEDEDEDLGADTANLFADSIADLEADTMAEGEPDAADEAPARAGLLGFFGGKSGGPGRKERLRSGGDEAEMSRLLDKTNDALDAPDTNRRRNAIAHLKAAVAATRAEKVTPEERRAAEDKSGAFRDDLARVVRPQRPESQRSRSQRPDLRPAPLKLVAEQRVDEAGPRAPVRPRRVSAALREEPSPVVLDAGQSFAQFAEDMGAVSLHDLLEAAAAYMAHVEGRDQFSRPQLMSKVRQVESEEFTREDGLRVFGQLLRDGKIRKLKGGRFTASDNIGFKPEARSA